MRIKTFFRVVSGLLYWVGNFFIFPKKDRECQVANLWASVFGYSSCCRITSFLGASLCRMVRSFVVINYVCVCM